MKITIEESLTNLKELQKDYKKFHDDVWQDPESYGIMAESLETAITTMRKYQKIKQILDDCDLEAWEVLEKIKGVIEDGKID